MNRLFLPVVIPTFLLAACGDTTETTSSSGGANTSTSSIISTDDSTTTTTTVTADVLNETTRQSTTSADDFYLTYSPSPAGVFAPTTLSYTQTQVTVTATIGDRNDLSQLTPTEVKFRTAWGTFTGPNSCTTDDSGKCSVIWESGDPNSAPQDCFVSIVAYTLGEESFIDFNDNGVFDDGDSLTDPATGISFDQSEPFVDIAHDFDAFLEPVYTAGTDIPVDVNGNGVHDTANGLWDGPNCAHSSLCGVSSGNIIHYAGAMLIQTGQFDHDDSDTTPDRYLCNYLPLSGL